MMQQLMVRGAVATALVFGSGRLGFANGTQDDARLWSARPAAPASAPLHLEQIGADQTGFHVTATLIIGPTESILFDAQYHTGDAKRVADRIAETKTHLKAIILSHADHDHYMGATEIAQRFPGTPVYMAPAGLADFRKRADHDWQQEKSRPGSQAPDSLVRPAPLPSMKLTVDGMAIEVIPDLTGDVRIASNSAVWIPSLRTVLAGDLAFDGIHPWLGDTDRASRAAWRASLKRLADLKPTTVLRGHKRDLSGPDSPDILTHMDRYLADFDSLMTKSATPDDLVRSMTQKYPQLTLPFLMAYGARQNFKK